METSAVITGDIINFTLLEDQERKEVIHQMETLIKSWVPTPNYAEIFRGDSYQMRMDDVATALMKSLQLICWFKKRPGHSKGIDIGCRISVGIGQIAYTGKTVLDSDGEAFHLSGRNFDTMTAEELLRIATFDSGLNKQIAILLSFMNLLIGQWSSQQAAVIYLAIGGYTQTRMAEELGIQQSAVNNRLRVSNWKTVKAGMEYIIEIIKEKK